MCLNLYIYIPIYAFQYYFFPDRCELRFYLEQASDNNSRSLGAPVYGVACYHYLSTGDFVFFNAAINITVGRSAANVPKARAVFESEIFCG